MGLGITGVMHKNLRVSCASLARLAAIVTRPETLPDFCTPPLNEVVVGVQFTPARGYQQIRAGEVWALFRSIFPKVEEFPALPPMFETFGLPQAQHINFGIVSGAT